MPWHCEHHVTRALLMNVSSKAMGFVPTIHPPSHGAEVSPLLRVQSFNEFDPLRSVIIGTAHGANHPEFETSFNHFFAPPNGGSEAASRGPTPGHIVTEIEEDIDGLVRELRRRNVIVFRGRPIQCAQPIQSPHWKTEQLYSLMPRDTLLVVGDLVIEVPSPTRARYFETFAFRQIISRHYDAGLCRWIAAPKPELRDESYSTGSSTSDRRLRLGNHEILFDGANCVRMGRDVFIDINRTANEKGARWLQDVLGSGFRIHPMHLGEDHCDVTLVPIRPGLILVDGSRVNAANLPSQFKSWDKISLANMPEQSFGLSYPMASNGIGRNILMLDPDTAVVEEKQTKLIRELERRRIGVIPLRYRHGRTLGGAWHCITLDLVREGSGAEDYFL